MTYQVQSESRPTAAPLDGTVYVLSDPAQDIRAEIWPALGFNCFHWQEQTLDLLYADPQLFQNPVPTRSGFPVLFPFPNRIRDGRFTWQGKDYQLPLNDPSHRNAIHGFACRHPWRIIGQGANAQEAWLQGEFTASVDAPEARSLWPANHRIRITYRLTTGRLRLEIAVANPDQVPLPFGLGFHPYFRVPLLPGGAAGECLVEVGAVSSWELQDSLPTGTRLPVAARLDLNRPRRVTDLTLDDVLTDLKPGSRPDAAGLRLLGSVRQGPGGACLELCASPDFRELVAFTPPHRHAIALEPYTCTTDAINLEPRGVDAGLRVLPPGQEWSAVVELRCRRQ